MIIAHAQLGIQLELNDTKIVIKNGIVHREKSSSCLVFQNGVRDFRWEFGVD